MSGLIMSCKIFSDFLSSWSFLTNGAQQGIIERTSTNKWIRVEIRVSETKDVKICYNGMDNFNFKTILFS